jgi:hypothetical protein
MLLYALCLNPLLHTLDKKLTGINLNNDGPTAKVVAYADDVSIFVTSPADITTIRQTLQNYKEASWVKVNTTKSKAIAIGTWDTTLQIMDIPYHNEAKILVFHVTTTVNAIARRS